jgi:regulator of protease activity HflC (stomatin/prohibitin superfamily)
LKGLKLILAVVLGAALLLAISSSMLLERVAPYEFGVKQNLLGGGIVEDVYGTGYHLGIVGVHRWHKLDGRVHFISFASDPGTRRTLGDNVDAAGPLDIRTSDNNTASLDVTVLYRIIQEEAFEIVSEGLTLAYRDRVRQATQGLLREELSKLSPEDFVNTDIRQQRVEETLPLLRETLAQYHVEPMGILIRAVRFPPEYEEKLQLKQLTRQKSLLAQARERQERQSQVTESIEKETEALEKRARGEWDKRLQQARSENQVEIARIRAEAEVYSRSTRANADAEAVALEAEGRLALDQAEALRDGLRNAALDTVGGRILLARQAAENLDIEDVTLNSNDPSVPTIIDIEGLIDLLVGEDRP